MKAYYFGLGLLALIVLIGTIIYSMGYESDAGDVVSEGDMPAEPDGEDPDAYALAKVTSVPDIDWSSADGSIEGDVDDSLSGIPGTDLLTLKRKEGIGMTYYRLDINGEPSDEVGYEFFFQGETVIQGRVVPPDRVYFWEDGQAFDPGDVRLRIGEDNLVLGVDFPHASVSVAVFSFRQYRETGSSEASYDLFQFDGTLG
jgi:hypothetical protein